MAVALGSVLALTATACGDDGSSAGGDKGAEGSGTGKIVFWDNNGGVRTDIWKEIIADFEKANPDIKVEYVGIPSTDYQSKVDTALQGGGLPDVGGVGAAMLAGFAAQGALEPLDDRLATSSLNGKLNEDMVASLKAAGAVTASCTRCRPPPTTVCCTTAPTCSRRPLWTSRRPGTRSSRPQRS